MEQTHNLHRRRENYGRAFTIFEIKCRGTTKLITVLIIRDEDGSDRIHWEALAFVYSQHNKMSEQKTRKTLRAVGMMADFYVLYERSPLLTEGDLEAFLGRFFAARYRGTIDGVTHDDASELYWRPVRWLTVKEEMRLAHSFFKHCTSQHGHYPAFSPTQITKTTDEAYGKVMARMYQRKQDFLAHLADHRKTPLSSSVAPPRAFGPRPSHTGNTTIRGHFPTDRIEALISATKCIVHRMVWILGAFGGPRLSEQLNLWIDDVLPGSKRPHLLPYDRSKSLPLVVLAHPTESTYTGSLASLGTSRLQWLSGQGRTPRPLLSGRDPLHAGWKGMAIEYAPLQVSQIYWADPEWAREYYRHYQNLLDVHDAIPKHRRHPYLYINMDRRSEFFGLPLKMSNIRSSFAAACERIGLQPFKFNAAPHKLRGLYRAILRQGGFNADEIQLMMHHISVDSQFAYPENAEKLNAMLTENRSKRQSER
jgi:hypothetical protein